MINAKAEPRMDAWLKKHAAFEAPLGQAVPAAGGPAALADDPDAIRGMIRLIRQNLAALPAPPVPRGFAASQTLPEGLLLAVPRRFLRGTAAAHSGLAGASPAAVAEYERMAEQLRACAGIGRRQTAAPPRNPHHDASRRTAPAFEAPISPTVGGPWT